MSDERRCPIRTLLTQRRIVDRQEITAEFSHAVLDQVVAGLRAVAARTAV